MTLNDAEHTVTPETEVTRHSHHEDANDLRSITAPGIKHRSTTGNLHVPSHNGSILYHFKIVILVLAQISERVLEVLTYLCSRTMADRCRISLRPYIRVSSLNKYVILFQIHVL